MKFDPSAMTQVETALDNAELPAVNFTEDSSLEQDPAYAETLDFDNLPFLLSSLDLTTESPIA